MLASLGWYCRRILMSLWLLLWS